MAVAEDLILRFETDPNRPPKAENVARALSAWAEILETAAEIAEPGSVPRIELVGVESGSQVFRIAIRKVAEVGADIAAGAEEYPLAKKAAISLGGMITTGLIGVGIQLALVPDPRIPEDQMDVFRRTNELLQESNDLERKNMEFYGITQEERSFLGVEVLTGKDRQPLYKIPRSEFAERAGLWKEAEERTSDPQVETRTATWDVTLLKPVLVGEPRRWVFAKDGLKFSALMADKAVLAAIHDKTLPLQVAEGVSMKIEVSYKESFNGQTWEPIDRTRKVVRVLHPIAPSSSGSLFTASRPEKRQ